MKLNKNFLLHNRKLFIEIRHEYIIFTTKQNFSKPIKFYAKTNLLIIFNRQKQTNGQKNGVEQKKQVIRIIIKGITKQEKET